MVTCQGRKDFVMPEKYRRRAGILSGNERYLFEYPQGAQRYIL